MAKDIKDIKDLFLKRLLKYAKLDNMVTLETARSHFSYLLLAGYGPEEIALNYQIFKANPNLLKNNLAILNEKYETKPFYNQNLNDSSNHTTRNEPDSITIERKKTDVRSYGSFTRLNTVHSNFASLKKIHPLPPLYILTKFCFSKNPQSFLVKLIKKESSNLKKNGCDSTEFTDHTNNSRLNSDQMTSKNKKIDELFDYGDFNEECRMSSLQEMFEIKSNDEMIKLLSSNIRLLRKINFNVLSEKVEYLIKSGATMEDLRRNSHILTNKSIDFIQDRCRCLISINLNDPLPVSSLGWTPARFNNYITRFGNPKHAIKKVSRENVCEITKNLEGSRIKNKNILLLKVRFLISLGYKSEEILKTPRIIEHGYQTIQNAFEYISKYHIGLVPLGYCLNYIENQRLLIQRNGKLKKEKIIKIALRINTLPCIIRKSLLNINISNESIHQVITFLSTLGITEAHIGELPVLVCHNVKIIEDTWNSLKPMEQNKISRNIAENKVIMALNRLQYYIERKINFKMTMGITDVNLDGLYDSDVEQNSQEPIVYDKDQEIVNTDLKNILKRLNIDGNGKGDYIDFCEGEDFDEDELDIYAKL